MKDKVPQEEELVLCTVNKILGTTVFVRIEEYEKEGIISTSEIAPGRIRNIRDYVVPNKKIVCKILRIDEKTGNIDLSLRRVGMKERNKLLEVYEREKNISTILKIVIKDEKRVNDIVTRIRDKEDLVKFFETATEKDLLEAGIKDEEVKQLKKILEEKGQKKKASIKNKIELSTTAEDGFEKIKRILSKGLGEGIEITYMSAPHYLLTVIAADYKEANSKLEGSKKAMEEEAKKEGCKIEFIEEK